MSKFQEKIINGLKKDGWIVVKTIRLSENGYPDIFAFKDGKAKFIECKQGGDTIKELQKYRIDELRNQGFEAFCIHDKKGIIYPLNL